MNLELQKYIFIKIGVKKSLCYNKDKQKFNFWR